MKQIATVERMLENGMVEIAVKRQSACAHNCAECAGCGIGGGVIRAAARDEIGVSPGDRVVVFSQSSEILGAAALVYLLPILFFFLGYAIAVNISSVLLRAVITIAVTALGLLPAILLDRKGRRVRYVIREKL